MHFVVLRSLYNVFVRVVDLGVMVPCETILQSVAKEKVETMLAIFEKDCFLPRNSDPNLLMMEYSKSIPRQIICHRFI